MIDKIIDAPIKKANVISNFVFWFIVVLFCVLCLIDLTKINKFFNSQHFCTIFFNFFFRSIKKPTENNSIDFLLSNN